MTKAADRPKCGSCERPMLLDRPVKVNEEDFDRTVLKSSSPVLVDFYADWCGPCKMVSPVVDELAQAHVGEVLFVKVDTDRAQDVSRKLQIRGIPTLILFRDGEEVGRSVGFDPAGIRDLVERAV